MASPYLIAPVITKILAAAVEGGMLPRSPCRQIPLPRIERAEMRFLTVAEVRRLAVAVGPSYRALILLGAYGGLPIGEMTGLRRKRLDLTAGVVEVAEVLTEMHGHLYLGPPKTTAGRRRVGLPRVVVEALQEHLAGRSDLGAPLRAEIEYRDGVVRGDEVGVVSTDDDTGMHQATLADDHLLADGDLRD